MVEKKDIRCERRFSHSSHFVLGDVGRRFEASVGARHCFNTSLLVLGCVCVSLCGSSLLAMDDKC